MPHEADVYIRMRIREGTPLIVDPSITIRCKARTLSLFRRSGGRPVFSLLTVMKEKIDYDEVSIDSEEQFLKLWGFLKNLKKTGGE